MAAELKARVVLSAAKSVARLGAIPVEPASIAPARDAAPPRIASLE